MTLGLNSSWLGCEVARARRLPSSCGQEARISVILHYRRPAEGLWALPRAWPAERVREEAGLVLGELSNLARLVIVLENCPWEVLGESWEVSARSEKGQVGLDDKITDKSMVGKGRQN